MESLGSGTGGFGYESQLTSPVTQASALTAPQMGTTSGFFTPRGCQADKWDDNM